MIIKFKKVRDSMAFLRRLFSIAAAAAAAALVLTGCSSHSGNSGKLSIVCVSFPEYDWTRQIVGSSDGAEITYLLGSGIDLHNYQPSAKDIMTISDCDIFMYVGGESDSWAKDALKEVNSKDTKVIKLMDVLGQSVKEEEHKEGMEPEEEDGHHGEPEYGAAVRPMFIEAEILSELDLMDSRIYEMREAVSATKAEDFSSRIWAMDNRKLFNHNRTDLNNPIQLF